MSKETLKKTPLALAISTAFTVSLAQNSVANTQEDNPFGMSDLSSGYMIAEAKSSEGKCGEGQCGGSSKKTVEGQCGALSDDEKALLEAMMPKEKTQLKQSMTEMMAQMKTMSEEEKQAKMAEMTPQQQAMIKMIKAEEMAATGNLATDDKKGQEGQCGSKK